MAFSTKVGFEVLDCTNDVQLTENICSLDPECVVITSMEVKDPSN